MIWVFLGCFLIQGFMQRFLPPPSIEGMEDMALLVHHNVFLNYFGLVPHNLVTKGYIWQLVTYLFFHGNLTHLLFNILAFWMFGSELCKHWRNRYFLKYFFLCGIGAAVFHVLTTYTFYPDHIMRFIPTIGASGAIYGILMAYALIFGNRTILFFFIFPMKARTAVIIIGGLELYYSIFETSDGVAHLAHLGGMLAGYLYLRSGDFMHRLKMGRYKRSRSKLKDKLRVIVDNTKKRGKGDDDPPTFH